MKTPYILALCLLGFLFNAHNALAAVTCTESDLTHIYAGNHKMAEALYACSGLSGLDVSCFQEHYQGISQGCMDCYATMTSCSVRKCAGKCMWDPKGARCRDCAKSNCGYIMEACTGLTFDNSPDFEH